jgi:hypothetical protein
VNQPTGRTTYTRLRTLTRYGLVSALLACAAAGCSQQSSGAASSLITLCGTTLWQSAESLHPYQVPAAHPGPGTPPAPASSQLPPILGTVQVGADPRAVVPAVVLVTSDCTSDPVVTVTPVGAARTVTVARTQSGGVAGLYLGLSKTPVTIRSYEHGTLVGSLSLP